MISFEEIRKPVLLNEENYSISEYGQLTRISRARGTVIGHVLSPSLTEKGYLFTRLNYGGIYRKKFIHRLVAEAFIPNPNNLPMINHKDTNKLNNHYSNLEWCDNGHNMRHARDNGLMRPCWKGKFGADHNKSIPVKAINIKTGEEKVFAGISEAAREIGSNLGSIWRNRKGIYKHTKNWCFEQYKNN